MTSKPATENSRGTSQTKLPAGTWNIDPSHSRATFSLDYLVGDFSGRVTPVVGTLKVEEDGTAKLEGEVAVVNIQVEDERMTAHLRSPDFFDAERTPTIAFKSDDVRLVDGDEISADGELTIRGVTRPVHLKGEFHEQMTDAYGQERIGLKLKTKVDRTEFGLNWNLDLPTGEPALANTVGLKAQLYLIQG